MGEAKRKNQRQCPALGAIISSVDCGGGRNSEINCPTDCPHNPFSPENYLGTFLALEQKLIHRLMGLLARELTPGEALEITRSRDVFTGHALHVWHVHGRDLVVRWRQAGEFARWSNDDRVMLDCYGTIRVSLLEILHVIDGISVLARDLLQPDLDPFPVIDASTAAQVSRYSLTLGWIYRVPAGWRASGAGVAFPDIPDYEPAAAFEILLEHLDAPAEGRGKWLLENMLLLHEAVTAIAQARNQRRIESQPGQTGPPRQDDLVPAAFLKGVGGIEVSSQRLPTGINSELAFMTETLRRMPDERIPAIGNLTPRQAAADPSMRPALVRLMKGHVRNTDRIRRNKGLDLDLNPILLELGLDELVQPPPPLGTPPDQPDDAVPAELTPPPPQPLLTGEDLDRRLTKILVRQAGPGREERQLADFLDEIEELPESDFSDEELTALRMCARFSISTMHPELPRGFRPDIERMTAWYDDVLDSFEDGSVNQENLEQILDRSTQPELAALVLEAVFEAMENSDDEVRDEVLVEFIAALAAAIWETAHWPVAG